MFKWMFEWANKDSCQPQPQQLQLGLHSGCCQTNTHTPDTVSVQVFNLHFSVYTGVQPTLLYLYRCSTFTSLSIQVFNLRFSICTGVQPSLLHLYRCSTYASLSVQVSNLHFSIYIGVQPTLLYL